MIRSNSAAVAFVFALIFTCTRAGAQDAPASTSTAEQARLLYVEGKNLRREGDLQSSLEKLDQAHALYATPVTALELGRAHALLGHLRKAIEVLGTIERLPVKENESPKVVASRDEAKALLAQYGARVAKLVVNVDAGARVLVDREPIPTDAVGAPWMIDPGPHRVEALRGDARVAEDVRLAEGESRAVTLRFPAPTAAPPPASPVERGANVPAWIGFGIGGVGVVTGAVTGILTLTQASDLKPKCTNGVCPPDAGLDGTKTLGTISTIAFVVGGAGIAGGLLALLLDAPPERAGVHAWVAPGIAGVRGAF